MTAVLCFAIACCIALAYNARRMSLRARWKTLEHEQRIFGLYSRIERLELALEVRRDIEARRRGEKAH